METGREATGLAEGGGWTRVVAGIAGGAGFASGAMLMQWGAARSMAGSLPFHLFLFRSFLFTVAETTSMTRRGLSS